MEFELEETMKEISEMDKGSEYLIKCRARNDPFALYRITVNTDEDGLYSLKLDKIYPGCSPLLLGRTEPMNFENLYKTVSIIKNDPYDNLAYSEDKPGNLMVLRTIHKILFMPGCSHIEIEDFDDFRLSIGTGYDPCVFWIEVFNDKGNFLCEINDIDILDMERILTRIIRHRFMPRDHVYIYQLPIDMQNVIEDKLGEMKWEGDIPKMMESTIAELKEVLDIESLLA